MAWVVDAAKQVKEWPKLWIRQNFLTFLELGPGPGVLVGVLLLPSVGSAFVPASG